MKFFRRLLLVTAALLVVFFGVLYWVSPSLILHPRRINWNNPLEQYRMPAERISVRTPDSVSIRGVWVHDTVARPTIIFLHGIGNCKERFYGRAEQLWQAGYSTVMIDLRAHGESGGENCTYGFFEKKDVRAVVDYVLQQQPNTPRLGILGHSLGGAVALQTLAEEPRLQFGIIESTFADFRDIVYDYQQRMFKISSHALADNAIGRAAAIAGFEPDSVRPAEAARRIRQPMLMVHGDRDERIKIDYGRLNFNNLASADKEFYVVAGGTHSQVATIGGAAYQAKIESFLARVTGDSLVSK
jgi:uncharacterized protein